MVELPSKWADIYKLLERNGPFANTGFVPGQDTKDALHDAKILVIGAGGLGCELLKDLALVGFTDIHVIDMDTIDVSNLNRQFLFRPADVGKPKATVAAAFIEKRIPGCKVTPYYGKIQDKDVEYYSQFTLIICGLDSVQARRWINATVVGMYDEENPGETLKVIVDGGTEGFKGQARIIIPKYTACYECSLDMQTQAKTYPICTIANTPRLPEHCIEYASVLEWPKVWKDKKIDGDDPEHITWIYNLAQARAKEFNITGVTYTLTQGVVKNIIPAIASTNAIVAASCANEAFKIVTNSSIYMNNYMMYTGDSGIYTYTFELLKKEDCLVCGTTSKKLSVKQNETLSGLIEILCDSVEFRLKNPSLRTPTKSLYMSAPKFLEEQTRGNLKLGLKELLGVDDTEVEGMEYEVTITDDMLPMCLNLKVSFE